MTVSTQRRLLLCTCFKFFVMSLNYVYGAYQGVVNGGEAVRFGLKLGAFILFCTLIGRVKITYVLVLSPLLYVAFYPVIFFTSLEGSYRQAVNFALAMPLLFINYKYINKDDLLRFLVYFLTVGYIFIYFVSKGREAFR